MEDEKSRNRLETGKPGRRWSLIRQELMRVWTKEETVDMKTRSRTHKNILEVT